MTSAPEAVPIEQHRPRAVVYLYSQTGQMREVAGALTDPLVAVGWDVRWVPVEPRFAFPFPWPIRRFFGVFPASVVLAPGQSHTLTTTVTRQTDGAPVVHEVLVHSVAVAGHARERQQPQQRVEDEIQREQRRREAAPAEQRARERHDARRHDQRERGRVHAGDHRDRARLSALVVLAHDDQAMFTGRHHHRGHVWLVRLHAISAVVDPAAGASRF